MKVGIDILLEADQVQLWQKARALGSLFLKLLKQVSIVSISQMCVIGRFLCPRIHAVNLKDQKVALQHC